MIWFGGVIIQEEAGVIMRVLIVSSHPLFSQGVESLLRREVQLDIVGREMDVDKAVERIKELRPDVVIVDSGHPACDLTPAVMRILREGVGAKVIGLNLQDNTMCIYRGEQRMVKEVKDLVEAIEPSLLLPEPMSSEDQARLGQVAEPRKTRGGQDDREHEA
jgi:AmiR/NasT family two-component response regulator